jgi:hypothetical protein
MLPPAASVGSPCRSVNYEPRRNRKIELSRVWISGVTLLVVFRSLTVILKALASGICIKLWIGTIDRADLGDFITERPGGGSHLSGHLLQSNRCGAADQLHGDAAYCWAPRGSAICGAKHSIDAEDKDFGLQRRPQRSGRGRPSGRVSTDSRGASRRHRFQFAEVPNSAIARTPDRMRRSLASEIGFSVVRGLVFLN